MNMQIGDSIDVDGNMTASGKLGGGIQASQAGDAVLLGSDGLIPASLLPSTDSGWVQPYFFINSTEIPSLILDAATTGYESYKSSELQLLYLNQSQLRIDGVASGTTNYTVINPVSIGGCPVFSRYKLKGSMYTNYIDCVTKTVSGTALVAMLASHIQSNITGDLNLNFCDYNYNAASGSIKLQDGELIDGTIKFYSKSDFNNLFSFSTGKWWIS